MMRRMLLASVLAASALPAPATARDVVSGLGCGLVSSGATGSQVGVVTGGPVAVAPTYRVEVFCLVRVGGFYTDASGSGIAVAAMAAPVRFVASGEPVDVCTYVEWSILIPGGSHDAGCRRAAFVAGGYVLAPGPIAAGP